jgi:SP family general alpha glucoside:H+ symporter-like MFS transporter
MTDDISEHHGGHIDLDNSVVNKLARSNPKVAILSSEAKLATEAEHKMTIREAIKRYPKAVAWSILFSTAIIMEGYDIVLVTAFFAYPSFQKKFGEPTKNGTSYQITAPWQSGLSNGARVGEIIGLFVNGLLAEMFGMKRTMIGTLAILCGFIFISFFAQNIQTLLVAEILMGIPWGVFQTLTTSYAAEVCPVALRGYLTTYVNMMWGVGQLLATGVLRALLSRKDEWSYKIPFALQWIWPVPLIIGIAFAPESPWWLVRKERYDEARRSLRRLTSAPSDAELDNTIAMLRHSDEIEKELVAGTSYLDCFKGINLRRTEIACIAWVIQAASGASLMGYSAYFFEQAGLSTTISFDFSMALYSVAIVGVFISWWVMTYVGRRTIYICGLSMLFLVLMAVGFSSLAHSAAANYATGSLLLVFTLFYDITIGSVCYSIVAEIPSSRLRTKTIVLARIAYNLQGTINNVITPDMINPTYWNWKGKAGFFWAGLCSICLVWSYFRLPEPKGRTYAELDILFEQKVSARKFSSTQLNIFEDIAIVSIEDHAPVSPEKTG